MTFQFPYLHILNLKEKEKEQVFSEYGRLVKKRELMVEELQSITLERDERLNRWENVVGLTSVAEIQQQNQYVEHLNQKIDKATEALIIMEEELRGKQDKLLEKQKDERMWNHLRDKSYDAYIQKENKMEQERLDEIATIRYSQQSLTP
jgi:flagellar protein FliJ